MKHEVTTYHTKKILAEALKDAMRSKPFSKITVSELIRVCGVNRKTFYYHFQDIFALLQWVLAEEAIQVVRQFDLLVDYEAAIRFSMDYVLRNDYMINCVYDSLGREAMKQFFCADFIEVVTSVIEEAERRSGAAFDPAFREYAARFYTEAMAGMLIEWAKNGRHQNQEQTVQYLSRIIAAAMESMETQLICSDAEKTEC